MSNDTSEDTKFKLSELEDDCNNFYTGITQALNNLQKKYNYKIQTLLTPENIHSNTYGIGFILNEGSFEDDR